jgi:hypothetical protein
VGENAVVVFEFGSEIDCIFEKFRMLGLSLVESLEHIDSLSAQD